MKQQEINKKIIQIENQIESIKVVLKDWANNIGKYHKSLKEISEQLSIIKSHLNIEKK